MLVIALLGAFQVVLLSIGSVWEGFVCSVFFTLIKIERILGKAGGVETMGFQVLESGRSGWNFLSITYSKFAVNVVNRFFYLKQKPILP